MSIIVAGGAGFIGSKLVQRFLKMGEKVLVLDNFKRGKLKYLEELPNISNLTIENVSLDSGEETLNIFRKISLLDKITEVWHMAANSDIPSGVKEAKIDFNDTFLTVFNVIEAMKVVGCKKIFFASSSAIYGDHGANVLLSENSGPLLPISNYGAMKLASEAFISASAESSMEQAVIFRFPNVVGVPATHGVILDFIGKLKKNFKSLEVLGNGSQKKVYLHADELVEAMFFVRSKVSDKLAVFNIGSDDDGCSVREIAETVVSRINPEAKIVYGTESRGWIGDVPVFQYNIDKIKKLGWSPKLNSLEAIKLATREIAEQEGF